MPCLRLAQSGGHENNLSEPIAREDNLRCRGRAGEGLTSILPRQGEVAGACQSEGEVSATNVPCPPPPSLRATSPWRGRILGFGPSCRLVVIDAASLG